MTDSLEHAFTDAVFTARHRKVARAHREQAAGRRARAMRYPPASWDAIHLRTLADESDRAAERALAGNVTEQELMEHFT